MRKNWLSFGSHLRRLPPGYTAALLVLALYLFALFCSIAGVNFGFHWDEHNTTDAIVRTADTGTLLPQSYYYPSGMFAIGLLSITPDIAVHAWEKTTGTGTDDEPIWQRPLDLTLRMRMTFAVLSLLSVLWTYLFILHWRKKPWEALLGAALLGLSWEVNYHSRWIASDVLMMQCGMLTMLALSFSFDEYRKGMARRWLQAGALLAGITASMKYTGAIFLIPVLYVSWHCAGKEGLQLLKRLQLLTESSLLFFLAYLLITPGTLLDWRTFIEHVLYDYTAYKNGFFTHTVSAGTEHFVLLLQYLSLNALSPYPLLALLFFLLSLIGLFDLLRERDRYRFLLLCAPVPYALYFITRQYMVVRNYLLLIPFMAILAARGTSVILDTMEKRRQLQYAIAGTLTALLFVNAAWILDAGLGIRNRQSANYEAEFISFVRSQGEKKFWVSEKLQKDLAKKGFSFPEIFRHEDDWSTSFAAFNAREINNQWLANRFLPGLRTFGPCEVNYHYYPSWRGENRIVVLPYLLLKHHTHLLHNL